MIDKVQVLTLLGQSSQPQDLEEHVASKQVARDKEQFAECFVHKHVRQQQEGAV